MFDSQPTPLDLKFRLFGFPIRVHPLFWLIMALLGDWVFQHPRYGPVYLLLWVACGFVSILVHELGHAVLIRYYGSPSAIVLTGFGGYAENPDPPAHRGKRIAISLAGPGAGFLFLAVLVGSDRALNWATANQPLLATYNFLFVMLLFWNLFNLLPIWPLDGGKVCRELCSLAGSRRPDAVSLGISLVVSGLLAVYGVMIYFKQDTAFLDRIVPWWLQPGPWMTLWFILFAVQSFLMLQQVNRQSAGGWGSYDDDDDDRPPWRR